MYLAGNATRHGLLIAVSHVLFYGVKRRLSEKETLLPTKRIFGTVTVTRGIFLVVLKG